MDRHIYSIFGQTVRIFLLTEDMTLARQLQALLPEDEVEWEVFSSGKALLEKLFASPPHMLISAPSSMDLDNVEVVRMVKVENVFRHVCAVLCITPERLAAGIDWHEVEADDFMLLPLREECLPARLELSLRRSTRTLDANPLTRLPGNTSIMQAIEQYIHEDCEFGLAYLDIDHFKSFNDKYGFSRGDEALLMTARLLVSIIMSMDDSPKFVGHVGGDDFVFILPVDCVEDVCQNIIDSFDAIVPSFYDVEDRIRGSILSTDRQGGFHSFPLMSISIAVVLNRDHRFNHFGEITSTVGQLKSIAKAKSGSCYVIDRRKA